MRLKAPIIPPCSLSHAICSRTYTISEGSPSIRRLKRRHDENEDIAVEEMSQTQEDSQGLPILVRYPRRLTITRTMRLKAPIIPPCSLSHTICSRTYTISEGSPSIRCLKRRRDENEDIVAEEMSQTQEDSQGLPILVRYPRHLTITRTINL